MLQKLINLGIYLTILSLPLYLFRFRVFWTPFNVLEVLIYTSFCLWLFQIVFFGVKPIIIEKQWVCPAFFIFFGVTLSTLFSQNINISAGIWKSWFIAPMLFALVLIHSIKTKAQLKRIIVSLVLSGAVVALIALFYWFGNDLTYDGRLRAFFLSPNHLAMYLSPILLLSLSLYPLIKQKNFKILLFLIQSIFFFVVYLTYSHGAWLGLIGALVFLIILRLKPKRLYVVRLSAALMIFTLVIIIFISLFSPSIFFGKSRLVIWRSALEIIKDHPWLGIGPGMFQRYYLEYQKYFLPYPEWAAPQPHNIFLAFWLQAGLIGLIGFIWLLVVWFKEVLGNLSGVYHSFLASSAVAMIYVLVHGLTDTTYWKNDLSVVFWLIIALGYIMSHRFD